MPQTDTTMIMIAFEFMGISHSEEEVLRFALRCERVPSRLLRVLVRIERFGG